MKAELEKNRGEHFHPLRAPLTIPQAPNPVHFLVRDHTSDNMAASPRAKFTPTRTKPILSQLIRYLHRVESMMVIQNLKSTAEEGMRKKYIIYYLGNQLDLPLLTRPATPALSPFKHYPVWTCYDRGHIPHQTGSDSISMKPNYSDFNDFSGGADTQ